MDLPSNGEVRKYIIYFFYVFFILLLRDATMILNLCIKI